MDKFFLNKEEAVLMVIDIQERLIPVMKHGSQIISKTNTLLTIANTLNIPVVVTQQYTKGLGKTVEEVASNFNQASVYEKITFSACTDQLVSDLKNIGRQKIIVTGMETHVCVFQTVRDLLRIGYNVFIVGDAVCSRSKENYLNALSLMQQMGAVITNTESVFFDLMKEAGTPEFKELSRLIK